jgi:asparagine synthase (glutamine-hydrolysing)
MSGFVAIIGENAPRACEAMLAGIRHRGPEIYGIAPVGRRVVGQNYLPADVNGPLENQPVPVADARPPLRVVAYDGQIANRDSLCRRFGVPSGAFAEERLLLALQSRFGTGMFEHLDDAIFSFVIADEDGGVLAARDLLGIKTLFYARKNNAVYLGSEIKALLPVSDEVHEFPPGHYMDKNGRLHPFAELPAQPPEAPRVDVHACIAEVRGMIERSVADRVDFSCRTASLLSGGIDSSAVAMLASRLYKTRFGPQAQLPTFALGVGESNDIRNARIVARHIDSRHHELIVDLDQVLEALDRTIYYLESFDPSLVRSAVANYLISRYARREGIEVLLSGEGGDEVFCGYLYLKRLPLDEQFKNQVDCLKFLHNNASLRLDHMNQCNQIRVVAPLISGELLNFALALPPELKQKPNGKEKIEKWIFRKAFEADLPAEIVWRLKAEFSQGAGSAGVLPDYFAEVVEDEELRAAQVDHGMIRSKEEYYYFKIFTKYFGDGHSVKTVGQWITL